MCKGIKKGIMELVDLIIVNKADGDLVPIAKKASVDYKTALQLLPPKTSVWKPVVKVCSALQKQHIEDVWKVVQEYRQVQQVHRKSLFDSGRNQEGW